MRPSPVMRDGLGKHLLVYLVAIPMAVAWAISGFGRGSGQYDWLGWPVKVLRLLWLTLAIVGMVTVLLLANWPERMKKE